MGQYRAEAIQQHWQPAGEGVETMHAAPFEGEDIVRTARIEEGADVGRNDRQSRVIWAAGFIDGEGNIGIYRNKGGHDSRSYTLVLQVSQVNPAPLVELQSLFGGSVARRSGGKKRRDFSHWTLAARQANAAISEMAPYLVGKKREAEIGMEFQSLQGAKRTGKALTDEELAPRLALREELMAIHRQSWS